MTTYIQVIAGKYKGRVHEASFIQDRNVYATKGGFVFEAKRVAEITFVEYKLLRTGELRREIEELIKPPVPPTIEHTTEGWIPGPTTPQKAIEAADSLLRYGVHSPFAQRDEGSRDVKYRITIKAEPVEEVKEEPRESRRCRTCRQSAKNELMRFFACRYCQSYSHWEPRT